MNLEHWTEICWCCDEPVWRCEAGKLLRPMARGAALGWAVGSLIGLALAVVHNCFYLYN